MAHRVIAANQEVAMRSSLRRFAAALFLMLPVLAPGFPSLARADDPAVWLTPGGGIVWLPNELGPEEERPVLGGILSVALGRSWWLEARGHHATSIKDLSPGAIRSVTHGEGNLTLLLAPDKTLTPYLTAGAGGARLRAPGGTSEDEFAWNGGAGFTLRLSDRVRLRTDVRDISYRLTESSGDEAWKHSAEIFGGIAFGFGGAPKDADGDAVPDKVDRCPGTPLGARVDATGCPIDGDGDGVFDGLDRCEDTPRGATVDAAGCPTDSDGDGILDGIDQCAGTPAGARVDPRGCHADNDQDGVPDGLDQCEGTPRGCVVNTNGCPSDADQDGVCDGVDKCPDTPGEARVDKTGCPIVLTQKETELLETGMIRLQNVNFDTGKATIKEESFRALDEVGDILTRWPELRIEIGGHTDSRGGDAYNQTLSEQRAASVLQYLTGKFPELRAEQFTSVGYGESQPIAPNTTQLGMSKNRRVEFKVLNTEILRREKEQQKLAPKE